MDKRRIILNDFLFNNDTSLESVSKELILIETEPILKEDIDFIKELKENPTDLAYVYSLSINDIECIKKIKYSSECSLICNIMWTLKYGTEQTYQEHLYEVQVQNIDNKVYLKKLQPILK